MQSSINELNAFLKGEYMAINSYEDFIQKSTDPHVKAEFQRIQQEHKHHAIQIAERIQNLGGLPAYGLDVKGKILETVSSIKNMGNKNELELVVEAYEGENMGIKTASEIVKGDLDNESMTLIGNIINQDKTHLNDLRNLSSRF
jgi:bacterioferritin (cytochrome b1)